MRAVLCALLAALAALAAPRWTVSREPPGAPAPRWTVSREPPGAPAPRCRHERCRYSFSAYEYEDLDEQNIWRDEQTDRTQRYAFSYVIDGKSIMFAIDKKLKMFDFHNYYYARRFDAIFVKYHVKINCFGNSVLESPALPYFETAPRVSHLGLVNCPLPSAGSLAGTFTALNITLEHRHVNASNEPNGTLMILFEYKPDSAPLAAKHFIGLEQLVKLRVYGPPSVMSIECGVFAPLQNLRSLATKNVVLTCEQDVLPSLRNLSMDLKNVTRLPMMPTLEELSLTVWTEPRPAPLVRCDSLRELRLYYPKMTALPDGWLIKCSHFEVLYIKEASYLTMLPPNLLIGTKALKKLSITRGALKNLPVGLFDYSPNLNSLELDNNHLKILPSGIFDVARRVQELGLSSNELESRAIDALAPLVDLTQLDLEHNWGLGDVCETNGYSAIRYLTKLKKLLLKGTSVTRICRDWREDMAVLEILDLSQTKLTELSFQDLQFTRAVRVMMTLSLDAPVTVVGMTRDDYTREARGLSSEVIVQLGELALVECDCSMYWTRRVLGQSGCKPRRGLASQVAGILKCTDGRWLCEVAPEDMVCARPEECRGLGLGSCTCDERPDDDPNHDSWLVRVHCEHAGLLRVPLLRSRDNSTERRRYELLLAFNNISELHADDLKNNIKGLDLRNNYLRGVDDETVKRLSDVNGMLRLAGNPFNCTCHAAPLLLALHARNSKKTDLINITCSNGSLLYRTFIEYCQPHALSPVPLGTWFSIVLGVLLVIMVSTVLSLASRERRFFVQAVLHRWGIVCRAAEPAEDESRRYDAFVTFSHKDEALVPELVERLEPTYRLCVHCRDWIPGRFISEQVVESVRESRRTIALVSRHFLASSWARAEFREAHAAAMLDARPRLIVVLLEEPSALEMDDILRRYVATHTYLRWGEPWLWDKLAVALPRPREPRNPESAPPAASPALTR